MLPVKWVSEPNIQIGYSGFLKKLPTSQSCKCSSNVRKPIELCLSKPFNSKKNKGNDLKALITL